MPFEIRYAGEAIEDLRGLRRVDATQITGDIARILSVNPTLGSKAVIKRLEQPAASEYRLRVGEYRVYYSVAENNVTILRVLSKEDSAQFLGGRSDVDASGS